MAKNSKKIEADNSHAPTPVADKRDKKNKSKSAQDKDAERRRLNQMMVNLLSARRDKFSTPLIERFIENHPMREVSSMMGYLQDWIELDELQTWAKASSLNIVEKACGDHKRYIESMCLGFRAQTTLDIAAKLLLLSSELDCGSDLGKRSVILNVLLESVAKDIQHAKRAVA